MPSVLQVSCPVFQVMDVQIMTEKGTNKPRGFGFAIFDDCDTVDKICIKKFIRIKVSVRVGVYGGGGWCVCRNTVHVWVEGG